MVYVCVIAGGKGYTNRGRNFNIERREMRFWAMISQILFKDESYSSYYEIDADFRKKLPYKLL